MKIVIETNGFSEGTVISINDKPLVDIKEFSFSMNPTRSKGGRPIPGKCKMQQVYAGDFRSYYAGDFKKFDEPSIPLKER